MSWLQASTKIKNSFLIYGLLLVIVVGLAGLYSANVIADSKWLSIISGLLTGFIVAAFQVFLSNREMKKLDRYDAMGIVEILSTRDDSDYYRKLIVNAKNEIRIQGVTCKRFLDDFASVEESAPEKNTVLIRALRAGLRVRILVAEQSYLGNEGEKSKATAAAAQLAALAGEYPAQFQFAVYRHEPAHSIFVIDQESIVGPSFPGVTSKFSPAIHLKNGSTFGIHYLEYFDKEWERWTDGNRHA